MIYALDTNILIALQKREARAVNEYGAALQRGDTVAVPSMVRYEARRELTKPLYQRRLARLDALLAAHPTLDLDESSVDLAVKLFGSLRESGQTIEDADLLIAATALRHGATLVTRNTRHFQRIPGLNLADWQQETP